MMCGYGCGYQWGGLANASESDYVHVHCANESVGRTGMRDGVGMGVTMGTRRGRDRGRM